jgi:hypothetical protein
MAVQAKRAYRTKAATISSAAVAISAAGWSWTAGDLAAADAAVVSAIGNGVSLTWDGTTPTSTLGMPVPAGSTVTVEGNGNVQALQLIRSGSGDATVSITLEKF